MISIVPVTLADAKRFVAEHHRHHKAPISGLFAAGLGDPLVAVAIVGRPVAAGLQGRAVEVTRLCSAAPVAVNASSRLYSACATAALALGWRRLVTYTRADEPGTSLRAANWRPTATVKADHALHGTRGGRHGWLPGLYAPPSEVVNRIRWEFGPDAAPELADLVHLGRRVRAA